VNDSPARSGLPSVGEQNLHPPNPSSLVITSLLTSNFYTTDHLWKHFGAPRSRYDQQELRDASIKLQRALWLTTVPLAIFVRKLVSRMISQIPYGYNKALMQLARYLSLALALTTVLIVSPQAAAQQMWTLSSAPTVRITDDGSAARNFARIVGARRLPDGRIVVAEARSAELRLFSARGDLLRIATRRGEGPNELGFIRFIERTDQQLVAFDGERTVWYSLDSLQELRRAPVQAAARFSAISVLRDGSMWGARSAGFRALQTVKSELRRDSLDVVVYSKSSGNRPFAIGKRPGRSFLTITSPTAPGGFLSSQTRFAPQLLFAGADSYLWFGDSGNNSVSALDASSGRVNTFKLPVAVLPWSSRALVEERSRIQQSDGSALEKELLIAELDPRWRSQSRPVFSALHADVANGVWVELFYESAAASNDVIVLSSQGRAVARLKLPRGLKIWEVGQDFVLGEERDADGLSSVVSYVLNRR
jgi:hypothetical protein